MLHGGHIFGSKKLSWLLELLIREIMHSSLLIGVALFLMGLMKLLDVPSLPVFLLASGVDILRSRMVVVNLNFITDQTPSGVTFIQLVVP